MPNQPLGHAPGDMAPLEFAAAGHALIDWIARYLEDAEQYPVLSRAAPGQVRSALPAAPPTLGEPFAAVMADAERVIIPGVTHWNHPGFFAYFAISGSAPGILAELLTAALNINGMLWRTSPAATELEQLTLDWLRQLLGLQSGWFGMITDTASISTLLALAAAREALPDLAVRSRGLAGRADLPPLRIYTSAESHSSVDRAAITLGLGYDNVVHVPVDAEFRMRPDALATLIAEDHAQGTPADRRDRDGRHDGSRQHRPGARDRHGLRAGKDLAARRRRVRRNRRGRAGVAHVLAGVDRADSLVINPHKWLFTPIRLLGALHPPPGRPAPRVLSRAGVPHRRPRRTRS